MLCGVKIDTTVTKATEPVNFAPSPIRQEWILDGQPVARIQQLSSCADGRAGTYYWDCTAGRFNWFYAFDEVCHILEGEIFLKGPSGTRQLIAGDTVFFPIGAAIEWTVPKYVRKLAVCRAPEPALLTRVRGAVRGIKRLVQGSAADGGGGLL